LAGGMSTDVAAMVVDVVRNRGGSQDAKDSVQRIIGGLLAADREADDVTKWQSDGRKLAVAIATTALDRLLGGGATHSERTALFMVLCQGPVLRQLPLSGTLAKIDFRGVRFERCRFERLTWANCRFDDETTFDRCNFVGGSCMHCMHFGKARFENIVANREAEAWIGSAQISDGKREYSRADLRSDVIAVISKFIIRGGLALRSIEAAHLRKGPIGQSRYREEIISELLAHTIGSHEISGVPGGGCHIRDEAEDAVRFFAVNNNFTGPVQVAFEKLISKLKLK
jgi:hypothetical protein